LLSTGLVVVHFVIVDESEILGKTDVLTTRLYSSVHGCYNIAHGPGCRSANSWNRVGIYRRKTRLIYWASGYPTLAKRGLADDATRYVSVMQQGYDDGLVQGLPDQYVIESWPEAPTRSTPETEPWTFNRSVLDFTRRFVKRSPR
jgi:hypothetical protein